MFSIWFLVTGRSYEKNFRLHTCASFLAGLFNFKLVYFLLKIGLEGLEDDPT